MMLWLLCEIAIIACDLAEVLGAAIALQLLFHLPLVAGIALLAAGQNATLTSTLAGQIVLEGFTTFRIAPWARRLVSRGLAIVPAAAIAWLYGAAGVGQLLVAGQVVLSLQLPFAVIALILLTSDKARMGDLVNTPARARLIGPSPPSWWRSTPACSSFGSRAEAR
jgi:manganese transport protein